MILLKPECLPYQRHKYKILENFSSNNQLIYFTILHFYWAFFENKTKQKRQSCSSLPYENAWRSFCWSPWDCLYILVFAGSSCIFAKCYESYQKHLPHFCDFKNKNKVLSCKKLWFLEIVVLLLLLKIKLYAAVTLACLCFTPLMLVLVY